jgi:hypothetical protein
MGNFTVVKTSNFTYCFTNLFYVLNWAGWCSDNAPDFNSIGARFLSAVGKQLIVAGFHFPQSLRVNVGMNRGYVDRLLPDVCQFFIY